MKTLTSLLFCLALNFISFSQVWIDQGATWHYDYWGVAEEGFYKMENVGDTLIEGHLCQQIETKRYIFGMTGPNSGIVHTGTEELPENYTYVSGDTVFYRYNNEFFVLFNFSASIGDEWIIATSGGSIEGYCSDTSKMIVTNTGTVFIDGQNYRTITVEPDSNSSIGISGTIVERFGLIDDDYQPFHYLFPNSFQCDSLTESGTIVEWYYYKFKCFKDNSFSLYNPSGQDCEYLLKIGVDENDLYDFSIHPNPAQNEFSFNNPSSEIISLEIYSSLGVKVADFNLNKGENSLNISELQNGIYFVFPLENGSKQSNAQRLIIGE